MKKSSALLLLLCLCIQAMAQLYSGADAQKFLPGAQKVWINGASECPAYIQLSDNSTFKRNDLDQWFQKNMKFSDRLSAFQRTVLKDGETANHYRYQQCFEGIPVYDAHFVLHEKDGEIHSLNGKLYADIEVLNHLIYNGDEARNFAINYIGASLYKWQIPSEEMLIRQYKNNSMASYFPKAELVLFKSGNNEKNGHVYAYKFDIYAEKPLRRTEVFVDAQSGEILFTNERIHTTDTPGSAITAYSGTHEIITDSFTEGFRLRETGRGNGIETYDMNEGTDYGAAVDFTDSDNSWNNVNAQLDQYATDAHWGAEMTYDYFLIKHNRNSIDDQGFKLRSYIHYDQNYANAFWDGERMTYGDGDGQWSPLTALDICGHEITHGLTSNTADLVYSYESGALNESYSDIFGTTIEFYGKPTMANWLMGENIGEALRSMSNPNSSDQPDTYLGDNWYVGSGDNGGVHTNSGVLNYWFYLLSEGGSGTNDNGDSYNVTGLGIDDASRIAFRTLTVYLVPVSQYMDARFYTILSAIDLFGGCSGAVESTTNALYAVGLGDSFVPGVVANFSAVTTEFCTLPAQVHFTNTSINGITYSWDFGDGTTGSQPNPYHNYTTGGLFTVSLIVDGGACGADTVTLTDLINVNLPAAPVVTSASNCGGAASLNLFAVAPDSVRWFDSPTASSYFHTGTTYATPLLTASAHYYVENQILYPEIYGGKANNSGGGGYFNSGNSHHLVFTTFQPVIIKSVKVYAASAGVRNIEIRDASGTALQNANIYIPNGESRIDLNFSVPAGNDFQLAGPGNPNLYRNNNGCNYPYPIDGLVTITESSAGNNPTGYYYYFYDWEVAPQPCISERLKVDAWINYGDPVAAFTALPYNLHCNFSSTSIDVNDFLWDFGDGNTSNQENPIHIYSAPGLYTVSLTVDNSCGTDMTTQTVNVLATGIQETGAAALLQIQPNPASDRIYVNYPATITGDITIRITDLTGKEVYHSTLNGLNGLNHEVIDLSYLSNGTYILGLTDGKQNIYKRIILQ